MLCCKCNEREAVIFISKMEDGNNVNEGYCMICARELGLKQVNNLLDKVKNLSCEDGNYEEISQQFNELMEKEGGKILTPESLSMMENMMKSLIGEGTKDDGGNEIPFDVKFDFSGFNNDETDISEKTSKNEEKNDQKVRQKKSKKELKRKYLKLYGDDLTQKALNGDIDRIIGRDREINRVIQILNRRTKNNPCLIGEPGVGKTAIAEGIALKIAAGDVPPRLVDKEIILLDLTALVAGTQFRGQFESRIKGLIDEVKSAGNIILFIDEVHNLVGTGDSEGTMSAANILKPALSRGEIKAIGATTFSEYRKYIEKDSALERRFQPVTVVETTIEQTVDILMGVKDYYEKYHNVKISESIVRNAVVFSERYVTDRFLPDKAIDLIDEACSCAALDSKDINDYFKIKMKMMERQKEIDELESEEEIDFEKVAKIKSEVLSQEKNLSLLQRKIDEVEVTEDNLAKVIELWTGIPASKIKESEFRKLSGLERAISQKIVGQDEAVGKLVNAVKRSRVSLNERLRPASFIFVGPTGVGKTELAKVLADELFDGVDTLIRLDMSEYMEKISVSRIIGSPPGYIGYDDAGQLTEKVRRKPYSVILFDEIEKAHPDVMNILLQILDDGKITDAHGKQVSFENTIIIMTSNAGNSNRQTELGFNKAEVDLMSKKSERALAEFLRPEFLARVDEVIVFRKLNKDNYKSIVDMMLKNLAVSVLKTKDLKITYSNEIKDFISEKAYSKKSGARDIQKVIRTLIEDKICSIIIDFTNKLPKSIEFYVADKEVVYKLG